MKDQFIRFRDKTIGISVVTLACSTLYFAMKSHSDVRDIEVLRAQNKILSKQINKLEDSFASVRSYTGSADALAATRSRPKPVNPNDYTVDPLKSPMQDFFLRGMTLSAKSASTDRKPANTASDLAIFADLVTRVDNLNRDTDGIVGRLRGLASILKHNKNLMRAIPSMQPADGRISSNFGWRLSPFEGRRHMHAGIDIAAEVGEIVKAPADGVVTFVGDFDSLGKTVVISHGNGVITRYGHLDGFLTRKGAVVKRGQSIAKVGSTGRSTGPHLHYEVWIRNVPVNPMDFFYDLSDEEPTLAQAPETKAGTHLALMGIGGDR